MLNTHNQLLLESYKEQAAAWKHEDDLLHRFTAVTFPLSIAALGVPYVEHVPLLLAAIAGLTLMTFWSIEDQVQYIKSPIRFSIMHDIEKEWDIPGHKEFVRRRKNIYDKKLSSHYTRCKLFYVYFVIVALLILLTLPRLSDSNPNFFLINKTVDLLIIGLFWMFSGTIVGWAMCQSKKKVKRIESEK